MENFPDNLHFISQDKHTYVCVSEGKKFLILRKFCICTTWMTPDLIKPFWLYASCYIKGYKTVVLNKLYHIF